MRTARTYQGTAARRPNDAHSRSRARRSATTLTTSATAGVSSRLGPAPEVVLKRRASTMARGLRRPRPRQCSCWLGSGRKGTLPCACASVGSGLDCDSPWLVEKFGRTGVGCTARHASALHALCVSSGHNRARAMLVTARVSVAVFAHMPLRMIPGGSVLEFSECEEIHNRSCKFSPPPSYADPC